MKNKANELRRRLALLGIALPVVLAHAACSYYPDSSGRLDDDAVFTAYAAETDFGSYRSFAIDPVMHVALVEADDSVEMVDADSEVSHAVTDHVVNTLEERGYTRVPPDFDPDLGVKITAIRGLTVDAVSGGYFWGYYGDYWGFPGWSYYYPYDVYYAYRPGSLIVDVTDLAAGRGELASRGAGAAGDAEAGALAVIWMMVGYRAYIDEDVDMQVSDAVNAIDQAFEQSPYLGRN